jgi:tellurite resistance protein
MRLKLLAICNYFVLVSIFLLGPLVVAAAAPNNENSILNRFLSGLFSGEAIAVILAGVAGYTINHLKEKESKRREQEAENGRLKFKLELVESTKQAVQEGMESVVKRFEDRFLSTDKDISELAEWVKKLDDQSDEALRLAQLIQGTQAEWLQRAEANISSILSADHPTLVRGLFLPTENNQ